MANDDCIWFKDKTCFREKIPRSEEFKLCAVCVSATDLADRSTNFTIATGKGPQ